MTMKIELPIQRKRSDLASVNQPDLLLWERLEETCGAHGGVGLAAIQVGCPVRQAVVQHSMHADYVSPRGYVWLLNGRYSTIDGNTEMFVEGCLSIPGKRYLVRRWTNYEVVAGFYNFRTAVVVEKKLKLGKPTPFQHEIDHFFDVLISDKGVTYEGTDAGT